MLPKRKIIEVFEELSPQDNGYWAVPDGVYEVEFALVAGGLNGESSDIYNAGSGGNGGGVRSRRIGLSRYCYFTLFKKMDDMNRYDIIRELGSYFDIVELVCPHTYNKWKDRSWQFLDTAFLHNLLILRRDIIKQPMYCNNWDKQGQFSQRGLRCNICQIVKDKKDVYLSAHVLGKAGDFDVKSMTAEQARGLILDHQDMLPYPFRLEGKVGWLHFDSLDTRNGIHAVVF